MTMRRYQSIRCEVHQCVGGTHNWLASKCSVRASGPMESSKSGVRLRGDPLKVYRRAAGVATLRWLAVRVPVRAFPSVPLTSNMDA